MACTFLLPELASFYDTFKQSCPFSNEEVLSLYLIFKGLSCNAFIFYPVFCFATFIQEGSK